jgi:hypothetical protein
VESGIKNVAHLDSHICKQSSISQIAMGFLQVFDVRDMPNPINAAYTSVQLQCHMDLVYDEVYSIQHYVIKFVRNLRQVGGFLRVLQFLPPI